MWNQNVAYNGYHGQRDYRRPSYTPGNWMNWMNRLIKETVSTHLVMREVDEIHNLLVWLKEYHVNGGLKRGKEKHVIFYIN